MFHAWRVESKREERGKHERNTKKERRRQKEKWQERATKVLFLGRSLLLQGLWSKAKGVSPSSVKISLSSHLSLISLTISPGWRCCWLK